VLVVPMPEEGEAMQLWTSLYALIAALLTPVQPDAQVGDGVVVPVGQAVNAH
jgi:hypothetical protein